MFTWSVTYSIGKLQTLNSNCSSVYTPTSTEPSPITIQDIHKNSYLSYLTKSNGKCAQKHRHWENIEMYKQTGKLQNFTENRSFHGPCHGHEIAK